MSKFHPLLWFKPSVIRRYGIAILLVGAAVFMSQWPALHVRTAPSALFLCAIMISAWLGGIGPGLLAVVLCCVAFDYYIMPPLHSFAIKSEELPRFVVFSVSATVAASLSAAQRSATESLRRARDILTETVKELQRTNDALQAESRERMQIEDRLRRSEGYLAEAQRLTHMGSFGWRVPSGEIHWSDETYRIFGWDPQTKPTMEVILRKTHPDDVVFVKETVRRVSQEQKDLDFEHRLLMQDGSVKHIKVVAHAVRDKSGEVEFVGAVMDITSAKETEDRTRLIIDTVPAQLWTETPEGVVDYVSRRWIDYTGMTLQEAVGSGWNRMVHPDDLEGVLTKWRRLVAEGKPREIESRLRRYDGEYRWFLSRCYPLVDRSGHIQGWYGTDTDIHDLKMAEETLRRSEGYLAEAQRLSHTGSWARDAATDDFKYSSEEFYRVLGFDPRDGQPRYQTFLRRIHPDDQARAREIIEKARREKAEYELDYRLIHPGGEVRDIHVIAHPVLGPTGELVEFVGTVMDITERKRAEDERERLRQAQADLARVNRVTTMGELTASLAHEVNQPIGAAVTNASTCLRWLAGDTPNLEEARAAAMRVVTDGKRAAEIISRVRQLFKKGSMERELVDVNEVAREMIVLLQGEAERHSIFVTAHLAGDIPQLMGDRVQLQQVMMNLIMNSIDAMKSVDGTRELAIISRPLENEEILVSVSDTGVGLPLQQADQIFNAFFTTKLHGTGMGLRISGTIVESHGGRLWAERNSPRGAIFHFTLPTKIEAHE
ncbi:MAG: PAS domain-containing protein [Candidatus Acidiferrales bacterium]|jgi:PAS domain S-box-containing protein